MIKVTFTLDDDTVAYLDRTAERLAKPKSQVVREVDLAIAACALTWKATLWTLNAEDFRGVPGLELRES